MGTLRRTLLTLMLGGLVVLAAPGQTQKNIAASDVPRYDSAQEVKLKGEVLEVKQYNCPISGAMGGHLTLATPDGPLEVHLAPSSFLTEFGISFAKGDKVQIVGVKVTFHDAPALLARRVTRNRSDYFFRDAKGRPLWSSRQAAQPDRT